MPLGLRLASGVKGDWGLDSVPDEVEESSLVTPVSSQPLSVSLSLSRLLPEESGWEEAVGGDLAASPLGVVPESFPGNVGYFCSAGKELSLGSPTGDSWFPSTHLSPESRLKSSRLQESFF